MVVSCSYKGCKSRYGQTTGISFFPFPVQNSDQCLEWMLRSGTEEFLDLSDKKLSVKRLCSLHFIDNYLLKYPRCLKLTKGALPKMYELDEEPINVCDKLKEEKNEIVQEDPSSSAVDEEIIPIKLETNLSAPIEVVQRKEANLPIPMESEEMNRLRIKLKEVTSKYRNERRKAMRPKVVKKLKPSKIKSQLLSEVSKYVKGFPYIFIKMQLKEGKFTPWDKNEKDLALAIYYRSPNLYKTFLEMGFKLPSVRSIQNLKSATD